MRSLAVSTPMLTVLQPALLQRGVCFPDDPAVVRHPLLSKMSGIRRQTSTKKRDAGSADVSAHFYSRFGVHLSPQSRSQNGVGRRTTASAAPTSFCTS